jgi:REP element-mobilizing transposase RayT
MRRKRKFYRGVVNHVYQKTVDGINLFYSRADYLVFFTILSVCAKSCGICIMMVCIMFDHFHMLARTESIRELSEFMQRFTSWFAKEFNLHSGRKGKIFKKNFGSAPKWDNKALRSAINYVGNNPVEKNLCRYAEEYRWGFLGFIGSSYPYSEPIDMRKAPLRLRKAVKEVDLMAAQNLPLNYAQIKRMFKDLNEIETEQLTDYIISIYNPIMHNDIVSYYGSYEAMTDAMKNNTGSEFDIKEKNDRLSHVPFVEMIQHLRKSRNEGDLAKIITLEIDEKMELAMELMRNTSATPAHIGKFLHMKTRRIENDNNLTLNSLPEVLAANGEQGEDVKD